MTDPPAPDPIAKPRADGAAPPPSAAADPFGGRWLRVLVVALLVVGAAELAVRLLEPAIPPSDPYGVTGAVQKQRQMQDLGRGGPVDVLFAGTSQTLVGIDPDLVGSLSGGLRSYNAALPGGTPSVQVDWLLDVVVPAVAPRQVVVGLSSLDLVDDSPRLRGVVTSWREARANRGGLLATFDRRLSSWSTLVDRRQALRNPQEIVRAVVRRARGEAAPVPNASATTTSAGLDRIWWDREYTASPATLDWMRENVIPDYEFGEGQLDALRRMLAALDERGIDVVILLMPISADLIDLHPRGAADVEAADRLIEAEAERAGVPIVRVANGPWPDRLFSDPIHLNGRGAELLSGVLGASLASAPDGRLTGGDRSAMADAAGLAG